MFASISQVAFPFVWGKYSHYTIIFFSCCHLFKNNSRDKESLAEKVMKERGETFQLSYFLNPGGIFLSRTLTPFFFYIQIYSIYSLLFVYTTDGFKNKLNLPVEIHAIPTNQGIQKEQNQENNTMLWGVGKGKKVKLKEIFFFLDKELSDTEIICYVFLHCVFKLERGS